LLKAATLLAEPDGTNVAKSYWLEVVPRVWTVAQGRMPLTRAAPLPRLLIRSMSNGVLSCAVTAEALRLARKPTVLPGLRASVPIANVTAAPRPVPLCELMNDAPLLRVTVPTASAVNAPEVLLPTKLSVALFNVTLAGLPPDVSRPDRLVPAALLPTFVVLSSVSVVPGFSVTPEVPCTWPTPFTVSVPTVTVVAPEYVSTPPRKRVLAPTLVRAPGPVIAPVTVKVLTAALMVESAFRTMLPVQVLATLLTGAFWRAP
jgi:hypothetical protein